MTKQYKPFSFFLSGGGVKVATKRREDENGQLGIDKTIERC